MTTTATRPLTQGASMSDEPGSNANADPADDKLVDRVDRAELCQPARPETTTSLEIYNSADILIRSVNAKQDEHDLTKWRLAEHVVLGANQVASALLRFEDSTTQHVEPSLFPTGVAINTIFV
jgi:hypothetical protein